MRKLKMLCGVIGLAALSVVPGGAQQIQQTALDKGAHLAQSVDILSDIHGIDLQPYLKGVLHATYEKWVQLIPAQVLPPMSQPGMTQIRITIHPDGTIAAMHLDDSSHDDELNHAAWRSVTGVGKLPPLPKGLSREDLELRIHFLVNPQP